MRIGHVDHSLDDDKAAYAAVDHPHEVILLYRMRIVAIYDHIVVLIQGWVPLIRVSLGVVQLEH